MSWIKRPAIDRDAQRSGVRLSARMLQGLSRWLKRSVDGRSGRSRFLAAKFKDVPAASPAGPGRPRELAYRLYLPSGSSARDTLPLIVMLHGCTQDPVSFAEGSRMNALAEQSRCAVLYPEQNRRSNALRCWNWFESASLEGRGEAALIARLIEQITERRPIDARRVFLVGMSAGGAMACLLAVRHSRQFAACAIHSGIMYGAARSPMEALGVMQNGPSPAAGEKAWRIIQTMGGSTNVVPALVLHGDSDATVNSVNADHIVAQLKARAEFIDSAAVLECDERRIEDQGRCYRQQDYTQRGRLVLRKVLVEGLGHAWSGGDARYEYNDARRPDSSRLILDFLMQYQRDDAGTVAVRSA
jgi:poly(hydroxyalkanoate) depolymerase family esterase